MKRSTKQFLNLESLEERLTPAFDFLYNPAGDIWTVTQVQDNGNATIEVEAATNNLIITDGAGGPVTVGVALGSLTINMMDNSSGDLFVDLDSDLFGNLSIDLGNGARSLEMIGTSNGVFGNVRVTGGTGAQAVDLSDNALLSVGGSLTVDLGLQDDTLTTSNGYTVGSNALIYNVNDHVPAGMAIVGGNFIFNASRDNIENDLDVSGATMFIVGSNLTYTGGNSEDDVNLSAATIGSNVSISLGNDISGMVQTVTLDDATIGGSVTVRGGTIDGDDSVSTNAGTTIGGSIYINTGTLGDDSVTLLGTNGGSSVNIITGLGNDVITYGMIGANARLYASLSLGNDAFTLNDNVTLSYLYIDFGFGMDTFTSLYVGPYPFRVYLRNLP